MADLRNTKSGYRKNKGKRAVKEKKAPRRGLGIARLETMRLLEQKNSMEEMEASRFPFLSSFIPFFSSFHLTPPFLEVDSARLAFEELAWNRSIGQWQLFDTCPHTLNSLKKRRLEIHSTSRDLSLTSMAGEMNVGDGTADFAAAPKFGSNQGEDSEWDRTFLDLSLSTVHRRNESERKLFKGSMGYVQGETSAESAGMSRAVMELELLRDKGEGGSSSCGSTMVSSRYGEEASFLASNASSFSSPSLQLTLGLPS
ncbi:uncharacterized protein LOC131228215 [Magnolia sinica]|uniref:uncharacterized protein LOC131228215 n=1 Tax=Magnolia sinica TaxID=86752 RepID=UPI002658E4DF|nr:uncharacterized protein LOC131228215 [Magnolia sinica]